jgi:uncharacterized membrane protein
VILGLISIEVTIIGIAYLYWVKNDTIRYVSLWVMSSLLILATTCASSQLVGSDIHLEYYYANQTLLNGWDSSLANTINSCLPITLLAPALAKILHIDLIWVFKVIFPLLFALIPPILYYVYSKIIKPDLAVIGVLIFLIIPTFFIEMPQIQRAMFAILEVVIMLAVIVSNRSYKTKMVLLMLGTLLLVASHYSTVMFWLFIVAMLVVGCLIGHKKKEATLYMSVLLVGLAGFMLYSRWVASGWQVVDIGNTIFNMMGMSDHVIHAVPGANGDMQVIIPSTPLPVGTPADFVVNWVGIGVLIATLPAITLFLFNKEMDTKYKAGTVACLILLVVAVVYPAISNTINYTRYFLMIMVLLSPVVALFLFRYIKEYTLVILLFVFLVTSGLVFNALGISNIEKQRIPYSVAFENSKLDAGNYLTNSDRRVCEWASANKITDVHGDIGAVLVMQEYVNHFETHYLTGSEIPAGYLFLREWNNQKGTLAIWVGPGLRRQIPFKVDGKILYRHGDAILMEVK